jgi:hypothetical protein
MPIDQTLPIESDNNIQKFKRRIHNRAYNVQGLSSTNIEDQSGNNDRENDTKTKLNHHT